MDVIRQMLVEWTQGSVISVIQNENEITEDEARAAYTAISRKPKRRTITERLLTDVASLYRDNIDGKPVAVIAEHYDVSEATAGRYVDAGAPGRPPTADHIGQEEGVTMAKNANGEGTHLQADARRQGRPLRGRSHLHRRRR